MPPQLPSWKRVDIEKLSSFTSQDYLRWLRDGIRMWDEPSENWKAFAPISDRFSIHDDIEPQIVRMFEVMNPQEKRVFLGAITLGFAEAVEGECGYAFFDSLQRLTMLLYHQSAVRVMVAKICDLEFLRKARIEVAQHLFAKAIIVIEATSPSNGRDLLNLLRDTSYFKPEYSAKFAEIFAKQK